MKAKLIPFVQLFPLPMADEMEMQVFVAPGNVRRCTLLKEGGRIGTKIELKTGSPVVVQGTVDEVVAKLLGGGS